MSNIAIIKRLFLSAVIKQGKKEKAVKLFNKILLEIEKISEKFGIRGSAIFNQAVKNALVFFKLIKYPKRRNKGAYNPINYTIKFYSLEEAYLSVIKKLVKKCRRVTSIKEKLTEFERRQRKLFKRRTKIKRKPLKRVIKIKKNSFSFVIRMASLIFSCFLMQNSLIKYKTKLFNFVKFNKGKYIRFKFEKIKRKKLTIQEEKLNSYKHVMGIRKRKFKPFEEKENINIFDV